MANQLTVICSGKKPFRFVCQQRLAVLLVRWLVSLELSFYFSQDYPPPFFPIETLALTQ